MLIWNLNYFLRFKTIVFWSPFIKDYNDYIYCNKNRALNKADTETKNEMEDIIKSKANARLVLKFLTEKLVELKI